jgi:hypothetical protein
MLDDSLEMRSGTTAAGKSPVIAAAPARAVWQMMHMDQLSFFTSRSIINRHTANGQ